MGILSFLCKKKSKADQTDTLSRQGIIFDDAKSKHLRLYFESQFSQDMEEDDMEYLKHIFEQKTRLLFGSNYSIINYINTDSFLKETFEKLIDTNYQELSKIKITEKFLDNQEMTTHIFNYKIITYLDKEEKICRVNFWAQKTQGLNENELNINPYIIEKIKSTNEIQIFNFLSENTNLIYFVLKLVFEKYLEEIRDDKRKLKSIRIYQIGMKTIDETMFTILASFLKKNKQIERVSINARSLGEFRHLKPLLEEQPDDRDEKMESEIHNMQHIFNLYQVLIKFDNLIELRLIVFLTHYNLVMLSQTIYNNQKLRILEVRNVLMKDMDNELDYCFREMNEYGDNIKDEIFIFFNYLFNLEQLEELRITHFNFFSEINFMAVQVAKTLKNLKIFSLEKNVGLINNDDVMENNYNIGDSKIEYLNMGFTYYHHIRSWNAMMNIKNLTFVDVGVVDFISFSAFCRFVEGTHLEKVIIKLNKPVLIESIPILFDLIGGAPLRSKFLKYFYVLNPFDFSVKNEETYKDKAMPKLYNIMRHNKVIRRLGFAKPGKLYYEVKDDGDFKTFKYVRKRDYESTVYLIKSCQRLFKNYQPEDVRGIIKNIVIYRFSTIRKFITG